MSALLGRKPITVLMEGAWRDACSGSGRVVVMTGGAAIGKSSILAWLADHVGDAGVRVVGRGGSMRRPMAVAGELAELLSLRASAEPSDPVTPTGTTRTGMAPTGIALTDAATAPRGADVVEPVAGAAADGNDVDPMVGAVVLRALLERSAMARPVAVLVDDLHDMDPASRTALNLALRSMEPIQLLVVAAGRPTDEVWSFAEGFPVIEVSGLAEPDARSLLTSTSLQPIAPSVADRLLEVAAGNPLAIIHLPRNLDPEHLAGTRLLPDPIPLAGDLRDAFVGPLAALGPAARSMVEVGAVTSDGSWSAICAVVDEPPDAALAELEASGLAHLDSGRLVFQHPLLRSAAIAGMSAQRRRELNRALAEVDELAWDVRLLHRAYGALEPDDDLVDDLVNAAAAMRARGGAEGAARLLDRAVSLTRRDDRRQRLRIDAADALAVAGAAAAARLRLEEVGDEVGAGPWAIETAVRLARLEALHGDPLGAWQHLRETAAQVHGADRGVVCATMAVPLGMLGLVREILETSTAAVADSPPGSAAAQVAEVIRAHAVAALDEAGVRSTLTSVMPRLDLEGAIDHDPLFALHIGRSLALAEMDEQAFEALTQLTARARRMGARASLAMACGALGDLLVRTCRFDEAVTVLDEAIALSMATGQRAFAPFWFALRARLHALRGARDAADADLALGLRIADDLSLMGARYFLQGAAGTAALTRGDHVAAIAAFEQCRFFEHAGGVLAPNLGRWRGDLVEAYLAVGRPEAAAVVLEPLTEAARRPGTSRWTRATAARVSAIAMASSDPRAAVALLWEAIEGYDPDRDRFDRARAQLTLGELLESWAFGGQLGERPGVAPGSNGSEPQVEGDPLGEGVGHQRAEDVLGGARWAFMSLGATPWVERVDALVRPAVGAAGSCLDSLSGREQRILAEVANGLTNQEIAVRLHLSPKTVANHLSRIYRKLDVTSRTEAARLYLTR